VKKILTALLLLAMLCPLAASCGSDNSQTADDTTAADAQTTAAGDEDETTQLMPDVPEKDYEGYEFRVMARNTDTGWKWEAIDVFAESENGEPINDAVYTRNRMLEENLNIKIKKISTGVPVNTIKPLIMSGEDGADVVTEGITGLCTLISSKYWIDYNDVPYIDFDAPWWDTNLISELTVGNHVYLMTGDITIMDNVGTWVLGFNKDLVNEYSLGDPYGMVNDGTWTYDAMLDMMKDVSRDLDGDGVMGDFDQYAFVTESYNTYVFMAGSGVRIAEKDENDMPYLSLYNDTTLKAIEKSFEIQNNNATTLNANKIMSKYTQVFDEVINKNFGEGKALFWMGAMKVVEILREYDADFGLLPTPKLNEAQERYYTSMSNGNCNAYCIPITNTDIERTGIVLEAMAGYSMYTLTPAYYDVTLVGKSLRDNESEAMLELVMDSRLYDLGMMFNWGNLFSTIRSMSNNDNTDFASMYASNEVNAENAIAAFIESLE